MLLSKDADLLPMAMNSREIERKFNYLKDEISRLATNGQYPSPELYQEFDHEFENVKRAHSENHDDVNLFHAEHNYYIRKSYQYLNDSPTRSLSLFISAYEKLILRHKLKPYPSNALINMLLPYQAISIQITESEKEIEFGAIVTKFDRFLSIWKSQRLSIVSISPRASAVTHNIINLFLKKYYSSLIDEIQVGWPSFNQSETTIEKLDMIHDSISKEDKEYSFTQMVISGLQYRIRKKELHVLVKKQFLETDINKRAEFQNQIAERTESMSRSADDSMKFAKKFQASLDDDARNSTDIKKMMVMSELDILSAQYYIEAYTNLDIIKAWNIMDTIKTFIVMKAFNEDIPIPEQALSYYSEEWSLLYIFAKICLLKDEVIKRSKTLNQEWEKDMFETVGRHLEECLGLFKYEIAQKKDYSLKIMTSTFSGHFSEYFVSELCSELCSCNKTDECPSELNDLLCCLRSVKPTEIHQNHQFGSGEQDVDIMIGTRYAILLKNAQIKSTDLKKIWDEFDLCAKHKIEKVFYGLNFMKNIESIDSLRSHFQKIRTRYPDIDIYVYDIRDLINNMIIILKANNKMKRCYSNMDLYRIMDY
jgi:hypothetical protein